MTNTEIRGTKEIGGRHLYGMLIPVGPVSVNVNVHNMTTSAVSRGFPSMRTFHKCSGTATNPISKPDWCETCGRIVTKDECIKGHEVSKGTFVHLTADEADGIKERFASSSMKVMGVSALAIKPQDVLESYLLLPPEAKAKKGKADSDKNAKFYALLASSLLAEKKYIVGKVFTIRGEYFMAVGAIEENGNPMLVAYSLLYANELKNPATAGYQPPEISDKEKALMSSLLSKQTKDINYATVDSELVQVFDQLIASRQAGAIPTANATPAPAPTTNDTDVLADLEKALSG